MDASTMYIYREMPPMYKTTPEMGIPPLIRTLCMAPATQKTGPEMKRDVL